MFNADTLPPLRDVIAEYDLRAEKSLGQNFLLDLNITRKILRHCPDLSNHSVFEIGPGPGGLTRAILESKAKHVIALELDYRAVKALQDLKQAANNETDNNRLEIIETDALNTDLLQLAPAAPRAIIANLPYNIATPLLISWLQNIHADSQSFSSMTLMFQKEVAERIVAKPGSKNYGRLAVLAQWLCSCKKLFDLPPGAFTPAPKVSSSIVQLIPNQDINKQNVPFEMLEKITAAAFGQRRKMIRSSLKNYADAYEACEIDPTLRAENLSIDNFVKIAKYAYQKAL